MINLQEELYKYKPMLEIEDIEDAISKTEMQDIMDMLNYIASRNAADAQTYATGYGEGQFL